MGPNWGKLFRGILLTAVIAVLSPIALVVLVFLISLLSPGTMTGVPAKSLVALAIGGMLLLAFALLARAIYGILIGRMSPKTAIMLFFGSIAGALLAVEGVRVVGALESSHVGGYYPGFRAGQVHMPGIELIYQTWTGVAIVCFGVIAVAGIIGQSGINQRARRVMVVVGPLASLAIAWAVFADSGRIPFGSEVPPLQPPFFSLWGLSMLGVLPALFVLMGGMHNHKYHPRFAPFAMMTKAASFLASLLSIWGFIVQSRHF